MKRGVQLGVNNEVFLDEESLSLLLQGVFITAIDALIVINTKGIILMTNPACSQIFGYLPEEMLGQNIKMLMTSIHKEKHDEYLKNYHTTKQKKIIGIGREVEAQRKNGEIFTCRLAVSEVKFGKEVLYTGTIHDMSEIIQNKTAIIELNKQLEDMVKIRTAQLEEAINKILKINNDLEEEINNRRQTEIKLKTNEIELKASLEKERELGMLKSRFVSMASHEFRTPLASILSSASLVGKYVHEHEQNNRIKHINRIKNSVATLTGILEDFLSLSRIEEGKIEVKNEVLDLEILCLSVIDNISNLSKNNQHIFLTIPQNQTIYCDPKILKNILFNLLSNAQKYSDANVELIIEPKNDCIQIQVRDYGIGIPEEDQKYLFQRFFRANNATNIQGTGLGLNIVKKYVDMLGGKIWFESTHGVGTTFTVELYLTQTP